MSVPVFVCVHDVLSSMCSVRVCVCLILMFYMCPHAFVRIFVHGLSPSVFASACHNAMCLSI